MTNQFSIRCAFCQKPHYSASCEDVCDVNKRKEILKRDGRCFVCLRKGHISKQCDKRCRKCQGLHHQSICKGRDHPKELSKKQEIPKSPVEADPVGPTVATSTVNQHSTTHGKMVLLQTNDVCLYS